MIEFKFSCPACGQHIQATDAYCHRQINCPNCQSILVVPQAPGAPPPIPAMSAHAAAPARPQTAAPAAQRSAPAAQRPAPPARKSNLKWILIGSAGGLAVIAGVVAVLFFTGVLGHSDNGTSAMPDKKTLARLDSKAAQKMDGPSAEEIFQKVEDQYASLTSYSAQGSSSMTMDMSKVDFSKMPGGDKMPKDARTSKDFKATMSKPIKAESEFSVKLGRPNLYLVSWNSTNAGASMKGAAWSAGDGDFVSLTKNKYWKADSRDAAMGLAMGGSGGAAATMPTIFFNDASSLLALVKQPERGADDNIDGEDCYVMNGDAMGVKVVFWVTKDKFLIKQKKVVFGGQTKVPQASDAQIDEGLSKMKNLTPEQKKQAKAMAKQMKPMLSLMKGSMTETYSNIEINKPMNKKDFTYDLPPGATLTKSLY